jgi:DNA-binding transcriptional LysR family regulator
VDGHRRQALERVKLAEIEALVAVAELGSFTAAAKRLHLTQPATTSRIQRLEAGLRTQLLTRSTRRVELTVAGERLLTGVGPLLDQLDLFLGGFLQDGEESAGRVVLASTPHLATSFLNPALRSFSAQHPGVDVVVLDLEYDDVLAAVDDGEADMAFLTMRAAARPGAVELGSDEAVLVVPATHDLAGCGRADLAAVSELELLMIRPYQAIFDQLADAARASVGRSPAVRWIGNLTTLLGLVDSDGSRVGVMTRRAAVRHGIAADRLVSVGGVDIRRYYTLFPSRYSARRSAVTTLLTHLRANLPL